MNVLIRCKIQVFISVFLFKSKRVLFKLLFLFSFYFGFIIKKDRYLLK